jgi:hypothetical protein
MSYSDLLRPRREVLSEDGIEGIADLANLGDRKKRKIEARPADFLDLTYPTADVRRVLTTIDRRFTEQSGAPGLFLFEGLKGSGKSHLLLMVYHLFSNRPAAHGWLDRHGLKCRVPHDAVVVINKFTDLPLHSIWDFVFERLTGKPPPRSGLQPGLDDVRAALGNRSLVLILDELEQGIRVLGSDAARAQNVAFLQMLSEWANREPKVTLFASIYSDQAEPGSALKRVPSCRVRFEHALDKARVVLHRLFANYLDVPAERARPIVESYLNTWRRHNAVHTEDFGSRMIESFPFSPDLLDILLERVPARGGFQNVRGALGFLARLVKLTHERADLITPAHAHLADQEVAVRLSDLDPSGDLIRRANENLRDLATYSLVAGLGATAMLYTLSGAGRDRGATREHLIRAVCTPGTDINEFEQALLALQKYGSYFHAQEGHYFFDPEENADAKVEFRSLTIDPTGARARELIKRLWCEELFRDPQSSVVFSDADQARAELESLETGRLRFVLSPRRLTAEERHLLYHGLSERNQVVLLEPKDPKSDALNSRDLIKWGQRALAAAELEPTTHEAPRIAEYQRIAREDKKNILDALRRAGLVYLRVERYGSDPTTDGFEEETLGSAVTREDVVAKLSQDVFPTQLLAEHLGKRLDELRGRTVKDIDREYRTILTYPVPTHLGSITSAVRLLCKDGRVGVRHPRGDFSSQAPDLTETELFNATLDAPFERSRPAPTLRPEPTAVEPPIAPVTPTPATTSPPTRQGRGEEIRIASQPSAGALRQQIAARLQPLDGAFVSKVRFTIFLESASGDLSSLPPALRGNLSGAGSLVAEITITKERVGGKADVEQLVERLPGFPGASYAAQLDVIVPTPTDAETESA